MDEKEKSTVNEEESVESPQPLQPPQPIQPPHSIFPKWQRVTYVYIASLAAFTSPVSSSIYYPAMVTLAEDLNTSITNISFTITTYMVCMPYAWC
jgi:hypothetical protein